MARKFYRNWFITLVVLVVMDVVWHIVIFKSFYGSALDGVARVEGGRLSPLIPFIILGDIVVSFGYTYLVSALSLADRKFVLNGLVVGLVVTGSFSIFNYALIPNWPMSVVVVDALNGAVFGAVIGWLLKALNKSASAAPSVP